MKPRPRKRTRSPGEARRGLTLIARLVTRVTLSTCVAASRTVTVSGRSPLSWNGVGSLISNSPTDPVGALPMSTPSNSTSTVETCVKSVPRMTICSRSSSPSPADT